MESDEKLNFPHSKVRVLVVNEDAMVADLICRLVEAESQFEIFCDAATGSAAVAKARKSPPDVVLLDLNWPDMSGLEVARRIRWVAPLTEILISSSHDGPIMQQAFRAGAIGFLLKSDSPRELVTAIRTVNEGQCYVSTALAQPLKKAI